MRVLYSRTAQYSVAHQFQGCLRPIQVYIGTQDVERVGLNIILIVSQVITDVNQHLQSKCQLQHRL
jgi:hypothetical protein